MIKKCFPKFKKGNKIRFKSLDLIKIREVGTWGLTPVMEMFIEESQGKPLTIIEVHDYNNLVNGYVLKEFVELPSNTGLHVKFDEHWLKPFYSPLYILGKCKSYD